MYKIKATTHDDCIHVSLNMREADVSEVFAASGTNPLTTLLKARAASCDTCSTIFYNNESVGIFGVCKINDSCGIPWLLGTDKLTANKKEFYQKSKEYLNTFMTNFKVLFNYVDERNKTSIKWLKSLGFEFPELVKDFGYTKSPFYQFVKVKNV